MLRMLKCLVNSNVLQRGETESAFIGTSINIIESENLS
jgi:hypothetical protein